MLCSCGSSSAVCEEGVWWGVWCLNAARPNPRRADGGGEWSAFWCSMVEMWKASSGPGILFTLFYFFTLSSQISEKYTLPVEKIAKVYQKSKKGWESSQTQDVRLMMWITTGKEVPAFALKAKRILMQNNIHLRFWKVAFLPPKELI